MKKNKKFIYIVSVFLLLFILVGLIGFYYYQLNTEKKNNSKLYTTTDVNSTDNQDETSSGRIICIGDSLTLGTEGVTSYPEILASLTSKEVITIGGSNDTSADIAARLGAYDFYTKEMTIPQSGAVDLNLYDANEALITLFANTGSSYNPVTIAGVEGNLEYNTEQNNYSFTRTSSGDEVVVDQLTKIEVPLFSIDPEKDILIIFIGSYDPYMQDSIYATINNQFKITNALGSENYIIVGLTSKPRFEIIDELNNVLAQNHGDKFLDVRTYLLNNGLSDANIEATEQDTTDMTYGYIPTSLLVDEVNGNAEFNRIVAEQLIIKMQELNFDY